MPHQRQIKYAESCDAAADRLGGYGRIDESLTLSICDALMRNPYGFELLESDWFSSRLIKTKPFGDTPALVWVFQIDENKDVVLTYVEEFLNY